MGYEACHWPVWGGIVYEEAAGVTGKMIVVLVVGKPTKPLVIFPFAKTSP